MSWCRQLLHGELPDQAALTGSLDRLDDLGVRIVDVMQVPNSVRPERAS